MDQLQDSGQADALSKVEITPAMIEAGSIVLWDAGVAMPDWVDESAILQTLYRAMASLDCSRVET